MLDTLKDNKSKAVAGVALVLLPVLMGWIWDLTGQVSDLKMEMRGAFASLAETEARSSQNAVTTQANQRILDAILGRGMLNVEPGAGPLMPPKLRPRPPATNNLPQLNTEQLDNYIQQKTAPHKAKK
ncbi:MAG: hypothetical protein ACE1Y4_03400 [Lysobacterales bacterium]